MTPTLLKACSVTAVWFVGSLCFAAITAILGYWVGFVQGAKAVKTYNTEKGP